MASSGSSAQSADSASATESANSNMLRSASGGMPQASAGVYSESDAAGIYNGAETGAAEMQSNVLDEAAKSVSRKIIKRGYISIDVENFDETSGLLKSYTEQNSGYIEQSDQYADYDSQTNSYRSKRGNMIVRIESSKFSDTMAYIETLGTVTSRSETAEDITGSYVDTQSRLEVKEQEKQRLMELLEDAGNMSDIITIEGRLTEVISDIESYQAQINAYDDVVDYSAISVSIRENDDSSIVPSKTKFADKAAYNFKSSVKMFFSGFEGIVLMVIKFWVPAAVILAIAAVVVFVKIKRKK